MSMTAALVGVGKVSYFVTILLLFCDYVGFVSASWPFGWLFKRRSNGLNSHTIIYFYNFFPKIFSS
jgi:hypothetical protein